MAKIAVIGGGIVGLACAHRLLLDRHEVAVIDRDPDGDKCSWGNAGGIAVSSVMPASSPGLLWHLPRYLADPLGPLAIRPVYLPRLLPWLRRFVAAGRAAARERGATALAALHGRIYDDLNPMIDAIGLRGVVHQVGGLFVYESVPGLAADRSTWELKRRLGIDCREIGEDELREMEPALGPDIRAGVFVPSWSHVSDPKQIWATLLSELRLRQVRVIQHEVRAIEPGPIEVAGERFEQAVVAAGAWSGGLAASIGDPALLESERGYNTTIPEPGIALNHQVLFAERQFVATPLAIGLRIGGAAEFAGTETPPNYARSRALLTLAQRYLPGLATEGAREWYGNRPATPDSLPVIGRSRHRPDIVYAFGHGHVGLTLAATTARMVADIVAGRLPPVDPAPYSIDRFR
jgi:D-amino-acid dehydrogenase